MGGGGGVRTISTVNVGNGEIPVNWSVKKAFTEEMGSTRMDI